MENQKIIRTYTNGYNDTNLSTLQKYLDQGYTVLMVTPMIYKDTQINEYILNPPHEN